MGNRLCDLGGWIIKHYSHLIVMTLYTLAIVLFLVVPQLLATEPVIIVIGFLALEVWLLAIAFEANYRGWYQFVISLVALLGLFIAIKGTGYISWIGSALCLVAAYFLIWTPESDP